MKYLEARKILLKVQLHEELKQLPELTDDYRALLKALSEATDDGKQKLTN